MAPSALATFLVAMTKCQTRINLRERGFILAPSSRRYIPSWLGRHDGAGAEDQPVTKHLHQEAEGKQEEQPGYKISRSAPNDPLPPTRLLF